jgi:hypothetical protein
MVRDNIPFTTLDSLSTLYLENNITLTQQQQKWIGSKENELFDLTTDTHILSGQSSFGFLKQPGFFQNVTGECTKETPTLYNSSSYSIYPSIPIILTIMPIQLQNISSSVLSIGILLNKKENNLLANRGIPSKELQPMEMFFLL